MQTISISRSTSASPENCWQVISDFGNIAAYNTLLQSSHILPGTPATGVGATRRCDMADGKNFMLERVVDWSVGTGFTIELAGGTMPVKSGRTQLGITPKPEGAELTMAFSYSPKFGLLGAIMDRIIMRRMFEKTLSDVVESLTDATEASPA